MKIAKYLMLSLACAAFASCMDGDWDEPSGDPSPFGNNSLEETNVVTIAELKEMYRSVFDASSDRIEQVTEDLQIKGWVTGNDIQGNIYQQVSLQDETGAIIIGISQGGLNGMLPIGRQILVELKDLYVGGYRHQCQIGAPYNSGIGRMDRFTWQEHFKVIGEIDTAKVNSLVTDFSTDMDMFDNNTKLMTFRNVVLSEADGTATYAPDDGSVSLSANCVNRNIDGASNVVLRTSTYADFAADTMLTGKVNITGIFTRYNNTWQILMRTVDDVQPAE